MLMNVVAWIGPMGVKCGVREDGNDQDVLLSEELVLNSRACLVGSGV